MTLPPLYALRAFEAAARLDKIASDEAAQAAQRNADQGGKDTPPELEYRDAYRQYLLLSVFHITR